MNPSIEWTTEERLALIGILALRMQEACTRMTNRETLYRYAERIRMIAANSPAFLEANRQAMLEGLP